MATSDHTIFWNLPARAAGFSVIDGDGRTLAECGTGDAAHYLATLINRGNEALREDARARVERQAAIDRRVSLNRPWNKE